MENRDTPLLCIKFSETPNFRKHRRVPLEIFWHCETKTFLRKNVIPPSPVQKVWVAHVSPKSSMFFLVLMGQNTTVAPGGLTKSTSVHRPHYSELKYNHYCEQRRMSHKRDSSENFKKTGYLAVWFPEIVNECTDHHLKKT